MLGWKFKRQVWWASVSYFFATWAKGRSYFDLVLNVLCLRILTSRALKQSLLRVLFLSRLYLSNAIGKSNKEARGSNSCHFVNLFRRYHHLIWFVSAHDVISNIWQMILEHERTCEFIDRIRVITRAKRFKSLKCTFHVLLGSVFLLNQAIDHHGPRLPFGLFFYFSHIFVFWQLDFARLCTTLHDFAWI